VTYFIVPGLPPSSNNAYFNMPGGGRGLTKEGRKYKTETKAWLVQKYMKELKTFVPNAPYLVFIRLSFSHDHFYNTTFGQKNGAETRYKKLDALNRGKLLEDVLKDVTGVDDSHTMTIIVQKRPTTGHEQTEVFVWNTQREESPFDEPLARL
jgi:hypothetical protein